MKWSSMLLLRRFRCGRTVESNSCGLTKVEQQSVLGARCVLFAGSSTFRSVGVWKGRWEKEQEGGERILQLISIVAQGATPRTPFRI